MVNLCLCYWTIKWKWTNTKVIVSYNIPFLITQGGFFNECLNVLLLKEGLGRVVPISNIHAKSSHHWRFYKQLLQAEVRAQKAGKGLWEQESQLQIMKNKIVTNSIFQKMKQLTNSLVTYWKQFRTWDWRIILYMYMYSKFLCFCFNIGSLDHVQSWLMIIRDNCLTLLPGNHSP